MVFIKDDGIAAPELVPDRWGFHRPKEEPYAKELGIKQKQIWEPGWRVRNEQQRINDLGITEDMIKDEWWSQKRLEKQGIEMPKAPKDHLNRLKTKGIDLFAEPRGSRYSLGAPPPYVTNPPEGSPLWDELQKFKRGEPSFYDTTKAPPRVPSPTFGARFLFSRVHPRRRSKASARAPRGCRFLLVEDEFALRSRRDPRRARFSNWGRCPTRGLCFCAKYPAGERRRRGLDRDVGDLEGDS